MKRVRFKFTEHDKILILARDREGHSLPTSEAREIEEIEDKLVKESERVLTKREILYHLLDYVEGYERIEALCGLLEIEYPGEL